MESRGENTGDRPKGRPAIARRSCDQCRARKIGCDRKSPCSNCSSARVDCTHSAVASSGTAPKQRVLISAQYEQKIDDISRSVDGIKLLLQNLNVPLGTRRPEPSSTEQTQQSDPLKSVVEQQPITGPGSEPLWDHSAHIIDFVKAVVEDRGLKDAEPHANEVISSLQGLLQTLEDPTAARGSSFPAIKVAKYQANPPMPPLEAVIPVLRWAKDHEEYTRIAWIAQVLPLEKFNEICRKVYFAVDDYNEIDFILANGYLSYIFGEYVVVSGLSVFQEYRCICRKNLNIALERLPLLLPPTMEVIATLVLGAYNAIESSKAAVAWTYISTASELCQRLEFHRVRSSRTIDPELRASQERLFWAVHRIDQGISLRLGRSSSIRDTEITLPIHADAPRFNRLARVQGKVYDQLFSPESLSRPDHERSVLAETLAEELRGLINETRDEITSVTEKPKDAETDPMLVFYLQGDMVCQSSLLALILRAIPAPPGSLGGISNDCVALARDTLDMHQECMEGVRRYKSDPFMVTKYINWAVVHTPFVPFSILFTRTVQTLDMTDLARLDRFSSSLQHDTASPESITHPYRLYQLLCEAARLYINSNTASMSAESTMTFNLPDSLGDFDLTQFGMDGSGSQAYGLGDWYYGNQQMMSLLDDDLMF